MRGEDPKKRLGWDRWRASNQCLRWHWHCKLHPSIVYQHIKNSVNTRKSHIRWKESTYLTAESSWSLPRWSNIARNASKSGSFPWSSLNSKSIKQQNHTIDITYCSCLSVLCVLPIKCMPSLSFSAGNIMTPLKKTPAKAPILLLALVLFASHELWWTFVQYYSVLHDRNTWFKSMKHRRTQHVEAEHWCAWLLPLASQQSAAVQRPSDACPRFSRTNRQTHLSPLFVSSSCTQELIFAAGDNGIDFYRNVKWGFMRNDLMWKHEGTESKEVYWR